MSYPPETPEDVLHPKQPLWARNIDENLLSSTRRQWHAIQTDRGTNGEWHQFRTRCGRIALCRM